MQETSPVPQQAPTPAGLKKKKYSRAILALYIANLFLAFHWYTILYVNSSFLNTFVAENKIGLIYTIGAAISLFLLLNISKILKRIGNYRLTLAFIVLEGLAILGMAASTSTAPALLLFMLHMITVPMIAFNLDIFLESYSTDETKTGSIRGLFLTLSNIALVISPAIVALVLTNGDYWRVYLLSALFLIPLLWVIRRNFSSYTDGVPLHTKPLEIFRELRGRKDLFGIVKAHFLLQFFYSWMIVYLPIHLFNYVGFEWSEIGFILTFMFLPFVLFELPAGKIADSKLGEKEILSFGFIITGIATLMIPLIREPVFLLWALVLFLTRVGASFVEITTESYFFKHVGADNYDLISFFRLTRPLSFVLAPLIASLSLVFVDFQYLFAVLGVITFWGLRYSVVMRDTR